ncbi:MAG: HlyD family efflux transporter periplasmic adaptor subunit [Candidatus Paceibacterota bacterium]
MKKFNINFKPNFKSKRTWIVLVLAVVLVIVGFSMFGTKKASKYETAKVERGNLVQTVDATGNIESSNDLSLHFDGMGIVENVRVKEGDEVRAGQWLANLSMLQLNAAVAQAQASLDQKLAGATAEQIAVSEKQVESAEISLDKAEDTLSDTTSLAEQNLSAKYNYALTVLDDSYIKMYNAYIAVKNLQTTYFTGYDQESLSVRTNLDYNIERQKDSAKVAIDMAKDTKKSGDIEAAVLQVKSSLGYILSGLTAVRVSCDGVAYKNVVTSTEKTSLDSQKAYISTAQTTVSGLDSDISILKTQNDTNIKSAQAAVDSAKANLELQQANYDSLVAKPRDIDIAYYQAVLDQAVANRNKAIIYAPIDGVVTKVNKKKGELISSSEAMIELLSPHYEIKVDVPETDVVKVKVGDEAEITLDALGSDVKFKGKVLTVDPASTEIQDVVYYKVKVAIDDEGKESIKPGMTADVLVDTDRRDNVVFVSSRAILTRTGTDEKYVRVLKDGAVEERTIKMGLKADDGKVEVLSGLSEGEEIVLREIK